MNPSASPSPPLAPAKAESPPLVEAPRADDYTNDHSADEQPAVPEPIDEDRHGCEFRDGQWVEKNVGIHASIVANKLHNLIDPPVRAQRLGLVLNAEGGYRMFPDEPKRLVKPDLSFVRRDRLESSKLPRGHLRVVPNLAVEIASPSDEAEDLMAKVVDYLRVGVPLVWVIYPLSKSVLVLRADRSTYLWQPTSELTAEEVIPGFSVRLEVLFEDLEAGQE